MEDFNLIISVASFLGVCTFIAMAWNHSKLIKQMQNDIYNNYDALDKRLFDMDYKNSCQIRSVNETAAHAAQWRNELMKKKYDDLCDSHSKLDTRVCDLTSTMWNIDGKMQILDPYIKRIHLKHLIKTSGSINKDAVKQLKEIENELK
jgi:deoxyhypusine synthase